ncbi:hypothetical protein H6F88_24525 [Oculatella sp. FACHB-28]|nr:MULTISPECIES: hypothetical protein [Cyanophyceae]MBD1867300.1 hypothetical protein [Cyanobacteria bacterium FACHB-471]MBD1997221.1 hypothetical protein [Leptolyngbya sp. FACHB-541]MBD2059123.1 hypothetical protein [Oculatella sp. FACHB-28]
MLRVKLEGDRGWFVILCINDCVKHRIGICYIRTGTTYTKANDTTPI